MTDDELETLMKATGTEGFPSDVRRLVEATQVAERAWCANLCELLAAPYAAIWQQTQLHQKTRDDSEIAGKALIGAAAAIRLGPNVRAKRGQTAAQEMEDGTE